MRKGFYSQGVAVLFDTAPTLTDITKALDGFSVLREVPQSDPESWVFSGNSVLVDYRSEVNGIAQIDIVARPWPDLMGDPKVDPKLFGAWSMGHFGPCTYPQALERAAQHAWTWREASATVDRHRAFARVRLSYIFGAADDALVQPEGTDPIDELRFVSLLQLVVASMPGALAAFNPNGELLLAAERLETILRRDAHGGGLPVDAWTNVRMYRPRELGGEWLLFDTPGLGQIDVSDHELSLPVTHPSARNVPALALSIAAYDADQRGVLGPGDTASDDSGSQWKARGDGEALIVPPRPVLRWSPSDVIPPPLLG